MQKGTTRVLLVEDESDFAQTCADVFGQYAKEALWGYDVETIVADTYEIALLIIKNGVQEGAPIEVAIADIWLPTVSGERLIPEIQALSPSTRLGLWTGRGKEFVARLIESEHLAGVTPLGKTDLRAAAAFVRGDKEYLLWLENKKELGG
ncbi:MAG: Response regulator [Patescibacteria group bacterium]|jgi:ActR/RegA family two-component response regulator|nr:Response regulator [Patescibacteria group bacterium]